MSGDLLTGVRTPGNVLYMEATAHRLTAAQRRFLIEAADNTGMKMVRGTESRTRDSLIAAGLIKMGRTFTAYLTREGYRALGRENEF